MDVHRRHVRVGAALPVGGRHRRRMRTHRRARAQAVRRLDGAPQWCLPRDESLPREVVAAGAWLHADPRAQPRRDASPVACPGSQHTRVLGDLRSRVLGGRRLACSCRAHARAGTRRARTPEAGARSAARPARRRAHLRVRRPVGRDDRNAFDRCRCRDELADRANAWRRGASGARRLRRSRSRTRPRRGGARGSGASSAETRSRALARRLGVRSLRPRVASVRVSPDLPRPVPHPCGACLRAPGGDRRRRSGTSHRDGGRACRRCRNDPRPGGVVPNRG